MAVAGAALQAMVLWLALVMPSVAMRSSRPYQSPAYGVSNRTVAMGHTVQMRGTTIVSSAIALGLANGRDTMSKGGGIKWASKEANPVTVTIALMSTSTIASPAIALGSVNGRGSRSTRSIVCRDDIISLILSKKSGR